MPERPAAMPATCVPCSEPSGSNGRAHALAPAGRRECAGHDDLAVRARANALREAGRVLVGGARERRPRDVDAVVDDADAHTVARGGDAAVQPAPDRGCPDHRGHAIGLGRLSASEPVTASGRYVTAGQTRRTPATFESRLSSLRGTVTTRASMTVRRRLLTRSPGATRRKPSLGSALIACERRECEAGRHAARGPRARARRAAAFSDAFSDTGRSAQLHDDLGACRSRVRGRSGEGQQRTERDEQGTRWQPHVFRVPRTGHFRYGTQLRPCCSR